MVFMGLIHVRVSDDLERRYDNLVAKGDFKNRSDAIRTALIDWIRDRERGVMHPGRTLGEFDREAIVYLLHRKGPLTEKGILEGLEEDGIALDERQLDFHLFMLVRKGEIEKKGKKYELK
jgi:Arc/MetJ-type ribon-helix-helix transcriptional regulator